LATGNHHPVGKTRDLIDPDELDVHRLTVIAGIGCEFRKLFTIHKRFRW
jgi:hypothetical protein